MAFLTKTAILAADDFKYAVVSCPEWGGDIRVRGLTAAEQARVARMVNEGKTDDIAVVVTIMGCVDEDGERIFDSSDKEQLKARSYAVLDRIGKKILELTGSGDADSIEDARKN